MMRLGRMGPAGAERLVALDWTGMPRDLSHIYAADDTAWIAALISGELGEIDLDALPAVPRDLRVGACVPRPSKFIGVGLNYLDHVSEVGLTVPTEPTLFMKAPSSICGPYDDVILPRGARKLDWEVELGVVIGSPARDVQLTDAASHIAGYCTVVDFSERGLQLERGGQWMKGKSADTFGPIGPWLVSASGIDDSRQLRLSLSVNGTQKQDGSTRNMIWGVAEIVSYVSQFMTLEVGDVIATGTPAGVGHGRQPPEYLNLGDRVVAEVEKLGSQAHLVCAR